MRLWGAEIVSVHVDELTSEVTADAAPAPPPAPGPATVWQEQARLRALRERASRDAARTCAEAYDD
jgi:hypothetical protein